MPETLNRAISCTLVPEKAAFAGFHVRGNPLLQFIDARLVQFHPSLNWIDLPDKKYVRRRIFFIKHLVAGRDIAIGRNAKILAAGRAESLVIRLKAAHARVFDIDVVLQPQKKTLQKLLGEPLRIRP